MTDSKKLRQMMVEAALLHATSHVEKHRINIEVYLSNPAGVADHPNIMESIEKELDEMARYADHIDLLQKHFIN